MHGVYRYNSRTRTWELLIGDLPIPHDSRLAFGPNGKIYLFAMNRIWTLDRQKRRWNAWKEFDGDVVNMAFWGEQRVVVFTNTPGIFVSDDAGRAWRRGSWPGGKATVASFVAPETLLVGTEEDGIFRSTNMAATWTYVYSGLVRSNIRSLVFLPDSTILAAVLDRTGIYRTRDDGRHWRHVHLNPPKQIYVSSFYRVAGDIVVAGTMKNGIYVSRDAGASWRQTFTTNNDVSSVDGTGPEFMAASSDDGVFFSRDSGSTWISAGLSGHKVFSVRVVGTALIASAVNLGLMRSSDNGATWSKVFGYAPHWIASAPGLLAAGSWSEFFRSTDGGLSWSATTMDSGKANLIAMAVDSSGGLWLTSVRRGLYHSVDRGLTWSNHQDGMPSVVSTIYTRNNDLDPLTGDKSEMYKFGRKETHPRELSVLVPGLHGMWYIGVEEGGIYATKDLGGEGLAVQAKARPEGRPGPGPGARRVPEPEPPSSVHEVALFSANNVIHFNIRNDVGRITSDKLALMFFPSGAGTPDFSPDHAVTMYPPMREFVPADVGASRELTYTFDAPKIAAVGQQDTVAFLLVSRAGAVLLKRVIFRYGAPSGAPVVLTEDIVMEKK
jgi:photosystem II stability/assembly factor-like uncharacterized protein